MIMKSKKDKESSDSKGYVFLDTSENEKKKVGYVNGSALSRDYAIRRYIERQGKFRIVDISLSKIISSIQIITKFLTYRNKCILILYPAHYITMGSYSKIARTLSFLCMKTMKYASRNNTFIFDIPDLKHEQAIDIEKHDFDLKYVESRERQIFSLPAKYVFASEGLMERAIEKYGINPEQCEVAINGGSLAETVSHEARKILDDSDDNSASETQTIKCVYAGTLTRGRQVQSMIDEVRNCSFIILYLLGTQGEWIPNYLKTENITNVRFLGSRREDVAAEIVSQCDVGLIPYDDSRLYYNIAYPTKLSFYICSGIPYLSTPVAEVKKIQDKYGLGFVDKLENWAKLLCEPETQNRIKLMKETVREQRKEFTWNSILSKVNAYNPNGASF